MYKLDDQEKLIIRELIRDPRISDNQIAIRTNVPLKTVNRKRKNLEENRLIHYLCYLDNTNTGTGTFSGRCLYIIVMREGITKKMLIEKHEKSEKAMRFFPKHLFLSMVGEHEGNVALITLIESHKYDDIVEIYNAEIIPDLENLFGSQCIKKTVTIPIAATLRAIRNYLPGTNMQNGKLKDSWPNENIYVDG